MARKIDRQQVYDKCRGHCGYCGKAIALKQMQVDHIRPRHYFYSGYRAEELEATGVAGDFTGYEKDRFVIPDYELDDIRNLMPACARCNRWKSTLTIEQFRTEILLQVERLNKYSTNYRMALDFGLVREVPIEVKFYFERSIEARGAAEIPIANSETIAAGT